MILVKTDLGRQVMKDRSLPLAPRQRSAFILFDGVRTTSDVLREAASMGVTAEDLTMMVDAGLLLEQPEVLAAIGVAPDAAGLAASGAAVTAGAAAHESEGQEQQRYQEAYLIATELASGLGLRGLGLSLAIESIGSFKELVALEPRIRQAVGPEKFARLARALHG